MSRNTRIGLIVLAAAAVLALAFFLGRSSSPIAAPSPTASSSPSVAASVTPSPSTATVAPGPARCHTADLGLTIGQSQGAAGTNYVSLVLTNKGSASCILYGFPGVSLLDASSVQLGQPATRNGAASSTLTLAAGQIAHTNVGFPNSGNFAPGACSAASTTVRVYPPDETAALTAPLAYQNCPGFSVSAILAGAQ